VKTQRSNFDPGEHCIVRHMPKSWRDWEHFIVHSGSKFLIHSSAIMYSPLSLSYSLHYSKITTPFAINCSISHTVIYLVTAHC
jgi:hypothetical protein